jgi:hypothetical protein
MSRYIDAEWLMNFFVDIPNNFTLTIGNLRATVNDAPSIDIVRCAECVYCNVQNTKYLYAICERHGIEFKPFEDDTRTHGCTWGERKESE